MSPSVSSGLRIRPARAGDAGEIARMMTLLNRHEAVEGGPVEEAQVLRDGFGERPVFSLLLAERDGAAVGYALYCETYDIDRLAVGLWLCDLYVEPPERGLGGARRLMAALARAAEAGGYASVGWSVLTRNRRARRFYAKLGAVEEAATRILELADEALAALAAEADDRTEERPA